MTRTAFGYMADTWTKSKRSEVMSLIKGHGNKGTELVLVRLFRKHKITGWRRKIPLPGKPDFTFRQNKLVVFVDGCFWHGCPKHRRIPKSNKAFWRNKIFGNMKRDVTVRHFLRQSGWKVVRIWEHELKKQERVLKRIRRFTR